MRLKGKVAIVTGASSGIGEGIAKRFLHEGAKVIGCGIEEQASIRHENMVYIQCDLCHYEQAVKVVKEAVKAFGKLNILVNSAGITGEGNLETTSLEEFQRQFNVNVNGTFNICKAAITELNTAKGSSIINIASELGVKPIQNRVAYNPSKAAVIMLTKCIAVDYAPNVRANTIMPSLVETPMIKSRFDTAEDPQALKELYESFYIMKRLGTVEDMANAAVFLASDESSYITGDDLAVCGGGQMI
jgi:NAD(P)-dependent dehydrogenase (short-subunit alcohol dehydrogenase family)